ncbi:hypothetical protein PG990_002567 [Apiospora arundinis]|uniref:Water stress and hypersensitive response domain-containing protein n=1 Tax=Apiospora arundinis TaxID=335852 RepID=A0ABR2IJ45_9PEZI
MDFSFQGLVQTHTGQMETAFDKIIKAILHYSRLDVSLVRISNVTEDTFHISVDARAANTGPVPASISAMKLDLHNAKGDCFGQIFLPPLNTSMNGARVLVNNQLVKITDKAALLSFVDNVMVGTAAVLDLRNGRCDVKALGVGPRSIVYSKTMQMKGMDGPRVTVDQVTSTVKNGSEVQVVLRIANPSPIEISFGICSFEIQTSGDQKVFAELKGRLDTRKGVFEAKLSGTIDKSVLIEPGKARLVGKRCAGAGWCDDAVKAIDVELHGIHKLLRAVGVEIIHEEELLDEKPKARGWFWMK